MADSDLVMKTKIEIFKAVMDLDPKTPIFIELAESLIADGRAGEAVEVCRNGLEHHPELLAGRVALVEALLATGRTEEAREAFSSARREAGLARRYLGRLTGLAHDIDLPEEPLPPAAPTPIIGRPGSVADPNVEERAINELLAELTATEMPSPADTERAEFDGSGLTIDGGDEEQREPEGDDGPLASQTLADLYLKQGDLDSAREVIRQLAEKDPANEEIQVRAERMAAEQARLDKERMVEALIRWRDAIRARLAAGDGRTAPETLVNQ